MIPCHFCNRPHPSVRRCDQHAIDQFVLLCIVAALAVGAWAWAHVL